MYNDEGNDDNDNDLVFLGNNQPWPDAFLAEGWVGGFYDDDNDEDDNNGDDDEDNFDKDV